MNTNRRSLKIKPGASVVDVKVKGRAEKAQSFAKAVIFSLFLLIAGGLYVRWDSLMELKNTNFSTITTAVRTQSVDIDVTSNLRGDKHDKFVNHIAEMKSSFQKKSIKEASKDADTLTSVLTADAGRSEAKQISEAIKLGDATRTETKVMPKQETQGVLLTRAATGRYMRHHCSFSNDISYPIVCYVLLCPAMLCLE